MPDRERMRTRLRTAGGCLTAFLFSAAAWTAAMALFGFFPFGDKTILITDMGSQYVAYHEALYEMLHGGNSLLFTWNTGMGMNFLGIIAYYLSSPFTVLLLLFPRSLLTEGILFILSAKIAFSGLAFSLFLRKAGGIGGAVNTLFSVAYALSAYSVVYGFNLMWIDGVVLLPLVVLGAVHLYRTRRMLPFILALTVLFVANFYIAYMVGAFTLLCFLGLLLVQQVPRREALGHFGHFMACAGLAAGLAAFLLLPSLFALRNGYESVHGLELHFTLTGNPLSLPGKLAFGAFDSATNSGTPNLYCGVLTLLLLPLWFFHREIGRREKWAAGILLLFLAVCAFVYDLDVVWHVFQPPTWFPCRYSFVMVFLLVYCAARAFARPQGIAAIPALISTLLLGVVLAVCAFVPAIPFAGEIRITLALLAAYAAVVLVTVWLARRPEGIPVRKWGIRVLSVMLLCAVTTEMAFSAVRQLNGLDRQFGFEEKETYAAFLERGQALVQAQQALGDDGFYRIENSTARNANDGLSLGYPAVSHYSSLSNQKTFRLLGSLGMISYVNNRYLRYYGATSLLDTILGVRYVFDTAERRYGYESTGAQVGDTQVFRNVNALPLAYFADAAVLEADCADGEDPFTRQNRLASALIGEETVLYQPLPITASFSGGPLAERDDQTRLPDGGGTLTLRIENPAVQPVLLYCGNNFPENARVYCNNQLLNVYDDRLVRGIIDLGEQPAGTVEVRISLWQDGLWFSGLCACSLDTARYDEWVERMHSGAAETLTVEDTRVEGQVNAPRDGMLFTSIPCDSGWRAYIDGEPVKASAVAGAFIAVPVSAGEHTFRLEFIPRGLRAGAAVSTITLLGMCTAALIRRRKKITDSK